MVISFDDIPVSGSSCEGGTIGEPRYRSTEPSL